jgi:hypothetical protein
MAPDACATIRRLMVQLGRNRRFLGAIAAHERAISLQVTILA